MKNINILLLLLILYSNNLSAQSLNSTSINISTGYQGIVIPDRWNPVKLYADRNNPVTVTAEIIRQDIDGNSLPPEIFPFTGNSLEASFFSDPSSEKILIRVRDSQRIIMEESVVTTESIFPGHLILTTIADSGIRHAIGQILLPEEPVQTIIIENTELPDHFLNYDGISGIIIKDPGLLINQGKVDSLKGWISCGGILVIYNPESFAKSLLSRLEPAGFSAPDGDRSVFNYGAGRIIQLNDNIDIIPDIQKSNYWMKLLKLKPYSKSGERITAGNSFPVTGKIPQSVNYSLIRLQFLSFFPIWGLCIIFIFLYFRKKQWIYILSVTLLFSVIAVPFALNTRKIWQRGAIVHTRAVVLPEQHGVLLNTVIQASSSSVFSIVSPWEIISGLGSSSTGIIFRNIAAGWTHHTKMDAYFIRNAGIDRIELNGYLTIQDELRNLSDNFKYSLAGNDKNQKFLSFSKNELQNYIIKDKAIWTFEFADKKIKLKKPDEIPAWIEAEISWFDWLSEHDPDKAWITGKGELSILDLRIMDNINQVVTWIHPLSEEELN